MRPNNRLLLAASAVAVALLASACGSSSSSSGSKSSAAGSSGAGSSAVSSPTGTPILVGTIGDFTGPLAGVDGPGLDGIKAWASSVNASGGIAGHPVQLDIKDSGADAAKALTQVKELVADKVVAIVNDDSGTDVQWAAVAAAAKLPVIGGIATNLPFSINPYFFGTGANGIAGVFGVLTLAKQNGDKFGLLYCAESPNCASSVPTTKAIGSTVGVSLAYSAPIAASAADYTAQCQALKDSNAQSYEVGAGADVVQRVITTCSQLGLKSSFVGFDALVGPAALKQTWSDGALILGPSIPYTDTTTAGGKAFQAAMAKYSTPDKVAAVAGWAWVAGKLFEAAVAHSPSTATVTSDSVLQGLYALKGETLGGLTAPLTYTAGQATPINCYFTSKVVGNTFVLSNNGQPSCAPTALVAGILAAIPK